MLGSERNFAGCCEVQASRRPPDAQQPRRLNKGDLNETLFNRSIYPPVFGAVVVQVRSMAEDEVFDLAHRPQGHRAQVLPELIAPFFALHRHGIVDVSIVQLAVLRTDLRRERSSRR